MTIRSKLLLLLILGAGLSVAGVFGVQQTIQRLLDRSLGDVAEARRQDLDARVRQASRAAVEQAALFAQHPAVVARLEQAATGDLGDEADPIGQAARQGLRQDLAPILEGYQRTRGGRFKLHVHLPGARSLVRLWVDKPT